MKKYIDQIETNYDKTIAGEKFDEIALDDVTSGRNSKLTKDKANILTPKPNIPVEFKQKMTDVEAKAMSSSINTKSIWFYCDSCYRGLQPLESRFDCLDCGDYSECKRCADARGHPHKMKKFIIPESCVPPSDEQIMEILGKLLLCNKCSEKMDDTCLYYKHKEEEDYFLCEACFSYARKNTKGNYKLFEKIKPKRVNPLKAVGDGNLE